VTTRGWIFLWSVAAVALLSGVVGALAYGFWGVNQDCHAWVDGQGYHLVHNYWWAKTRGCVASTPSGDEVFHSEGLGSKATGWVWQLAIFALGAVPGVVLIVVATMRRSD
jgi:hypothetical protein